MRRASLLTLTVALVLALFVSVAVAATLKGTTGDDLINGTPENDRIAGWGGDDQLSGRAGGDYINDGPGNDVIFGDSGNDRLVGNLGRDTFAAGNGNDKVFAHGNGVDTISNCGWGFDEAYVSLNDLIGGESVRDILTHVTGVSRPALSCEVLILEGLRIPLGAIVALPQDLETDVSLLLEEYLADGELDPGEIEDLQEVFDLIENDLLDDLRDLLDNLLGGSL